MPATATKPKKPTTRLSGRGALKMYKGSGDNAYTHYSAHTIDEARRLGVNVLIIRNGKPVPAPARRVHRKLTECYGEGHDRAGEGKYIDVGAYKNDQYLVVEGGSGVNPFLEAERCNWTIVEMFKRDAGAKALAGLTADIRQSKEDGEHLVWRGNRNADGLLVASPWRTADELWDLARKLNPKLEAGLRRSKSPRKVARNFLNAKGKFVQNLEVNRRARVVVHVDTGDREFAGGATPCAFPLEQCGMAIDHRYLTTGIDDDGEETGVYHYRMVWGRPEPRPLLKRKWFGEGEDSRWAYLSDAVRTRVHKIAKRIKAKAA